MQANVSVMQPENNSVCGSRIKSVPLQLPSHHGQPEDNSDNKCNHGNNGEHLYSIYYVPGTILGALQILTLIILTIVLDGFYYYLHFSVRSSTERLASIYC